MSHVYADFVVVTFMGHVTHNLKISAHHFLMYDLEALFCEQFISVFITIHLTNFIFLDIFSAVNIKY